MPTENLQSGQSSVATIIVVMAFFLGGHILLSYAGLVPSEVSQFNQRVMSEVKNFDQLSYQRTRKPVLPRSSLSASQENEVVGEEPKQITIEKIGVSSEISTPDTADVPTLDAALKKGVVHYPGSGGIGGSRRMFLFGHSSRLPVVQNEAYQAFNGLNKLEAGDEITVTGGGEELTYRVSRVEIADKDEALVSLESGPGQLTLSTCTTFGARQNRVVVRAELITNLSLN